MQMAREAAKKMGVEMLEGSVDNTAAVGEVTSSLVSRGADVIVVIGDVTVGLGDRRGDRAGEEGEDSGDRGAARLRAARRAVRGGRGLLYGRPADGRDGGAHVQGRGPGEDADNLSLPKTYGVNLTVAEGLKDRWTVPAELLAKATTVVDGSGRACEEVSGSGEGHRVKHC